ncbi:MAG: hypothetical protein L6428_15870 [Candidatus Aminicenantes bacterium]|nr:hypothetical protein [Acidobacteriota bacterium]MCG2812911.1 hypothetical protein [Candidatus Aminicenantes bacterium]
MKEKVIEYYENTRQYYGTYHNHKELSAWGGLALYVLFASLINWVRLPDTCKTVWALGLTVSVLVGVILVYRYISTQLEMKDLAGAYAAAAFLFLADLIVSDKDDKELREYLRVEESTDTHAQSSHVLPEIFLKKAKILNTRGRGFQDTTRSMIYGILILVTVLIIAIKWGQTIG